MGVYFDAKGTRHMSKKTQPEVGQAPHFVFFITDQQRADWLGCYGHPVVNTPHIDALAEQGTRFDNFHVASPVCMPNRASLMTGRYPSVHGLRYNGCTLSKRANTFVDVLARAGYKTAAFGKSHLQPFTGLKAPNDQPDMVDEAWQLEGDDYTLEEPQHYSGDGYFDFPTPYYGFQHVDMVTGHGVQVGGHYLQWLRQNHPDWEQWVDTDIQLPHSYTCPQVNRTTMPEEAYPTFYIRDRAIEYLQHNLQQPQPTFTFISFPDPHHPWNPPGRYWDMYSPDQFAVPVGFKDHNNPPPNLVYLHQQFLKGDLPAAKQVAFMADGQHIKQAMALTAGMITMVDDAIGDIVQAVRATSAGDNTIFCLTSDHGDYLGDFDLLLKGSWPKESICRVPFIWSEPNSAQVGHTDALCSTIDIASTILGRAGLPLYNGIQGRSLLPVLRGEVKNNDFRASLLLEMNDLTPRFGFTKAARVRQLLKDVWALTVYAGEDWGELYNRADDPNECQNLWGDPKYAEIQAALIMELSVQLIKQMDESPRAQRYA